MDEEKHYDFALGGKHKIPPRVNILNFCTARINEITSMRQALKTTTASKLAFQQLPKHMRRRAMAHNTKRLPRRLRQKHLSQLKKAGMPVKQKRPSRKYRRRPSNLLAEYMNRQRRIKWLETHIWHAKRFRMLERWGFKIAYKPCDKAFRACYRATAKHCLVQDISYISCIEIKGPEEILIRKLKDISQRNNGLSVGAKAYLNGSREGSVVLYDEDLPLGTIFFHWKPLDNNEEMERIIWIWVHAAYYLKTLKLLIKTFNLEQIGEESTLYSNSQVQLIELRNSLNRFKLTGPLSCAVLSNCLKTAKESNSKWMQDYCSVVNNLEKISLQYEYWENVKSLLTAAVLPPHHILSLTVVDPRYSMPKTRLKAVSQFCSMSTPMNIPPKLAYGPIWDSQVRSHVKENKVSNAKLNEMRSELLVPGTDLKNGEAVPIMLIQNPGSKVDNLGYGSGWDLIVPSGWGNSFWQTLIMWGARAGGLREFDSLRLESGQLPFLTPDSEAGRMDEKRCCDVGKQRYFSLPPNKRPNYNKLSIIEPFSLNWSILVQDWNPKQNNSDKFFVLRNNKLLTELRDAFKKPKCINFDFDSNYLIPVRLKLVNKGTIKQFARICLPKPHDLIKNSLPCEPLKEDLNQTVRKEKRDAHRQLLKKLRRERIKARREGEKVSTLNLEAVKDFADQMRKLWLPGAINGLRYSCSREIMGYVTSGDFSFTQARHCGVGYITSGALKVLLDEKVKDKILIRNISSRQFRLATIEIVVS
ncbi:hypothetical protein RI129_008885 [Pyrocoelia pectoralis]|uniref:Uncharacterized protein n=1 Tax=Pyrocoelia pectoralis TaxID=417401 RepID=A0AAN7V9F3_9COLE